jgi:hypothetical protein
VNLKGNIVCPCCKSEWFMEVTFNRFSARSVGINPGADHEIVSQTPQTIRICLRGMPYFPKLIRPPFAPRMNAETKSFLESLKAAQDFLTRESE